MVIGEGQDRVGLSVLMRGTDVEVTLTAANPKTAEALDKSSGELANTLKEQGLTLDLSTQSDESRRDEPREAPPSGHEDGHRAHELQYQGVRVIA